MSGKALRHGSIKYGLGHLAKKKGVDAKAIAEAISTEDKSVQESTVQSWMDGERMPKKKVFLKRLEAYFDTDIYTLLGY